MFKALCVAAVVALAAVVPGRSLQAQTLLPTVLDESEMTTEALLASYPILVPVAATGDSAATNRALVIGAGAIAGVVALNFYMGGLAYLPFTGVAAATPLATAESIVAISRVYAVTAAVAGGLVANWLYERQ